MPAGQNVAGASGDTSKPKVPSKPPRLGSFSAAGSPSQAFPDHLGQQLCLENEKDHILGAGESCFHRHETTYRREFQGGEPVETITQMCELAAAESQPRRRVEQCVCSNALKQGLARPPSEDAEFKDRDEEAFAGIFV